MRELLRSLGRLILASIGGALCTVVVILGVLLLAPSSANQDYRRVWPLIVGAAGMAAGLLVTRAILRRIRPVSRWRLELEREMQEALRGIPAPEARRGTSVSIVDGGFIWRHGHRATSVRWRELTAISIASTRTMFGGTRASWVFALEGGTEVRVPLLHVGAGILRELQRAFDLDNQVIVAAMGKTSGGEFVCWRRPGQRGETSRG
jgi:hypothetical protein